MKITITNRTVFWIFAVVLPLFYMGASIADYYVNCPPECREYTDWFDEKCYIDKDDGARIYSESIEYNVNQFFLIGRFIAVVVLMMASVFSAFLFIIFLNRLAKNDIEFSYTIDLSKWKWNKTMDPELAMLYREMAAAYSEGDNSLGDSLLDKIRELERRE